MRLALSLAILLIASPLHAQSPRCSASGERLAEGGAVQAAHTNGSDADVAALLSTEVEDGVLCAAASARRLLLSTVQQSWDGEAWVNVIRRSNQYDPQLNLTESLLEDWDGTAWINDAREIHAYDSDARLATVVFESWEGSWLADRQSVYAYDQEGLLAEILNNDRSNDTWRLRGRDQFAYDGSGRLVSQTTDDYDGTDDEWKPNAQVLTSYPSDATVETVGQLRSAADTEWVNSTRAVYTRTSETTSERPYYFWEDGAWQLVSLRDNVYDENDFRVGYYFELCDESGCEPFLQGGWTRDEAGLIYDGIMERWNGTAWQPFRRTVYAFANANPVSNEAPLAPTLFRVTAYPNPARDVVLVKATSAEVLSVSVYDLTGRRVAVLDAQPGAGAVRWDTRALPAGTYLLRVSQDGQVVTQKITLAR
ncbi:MAG: T9SS type A sorting domain-containing protein [Bacteroidota bacterium]